MNKKLLFKYGGGGIISTEVHEKHAMWILLQYMYGSKIEKKGVRI